MGQEIEIKLRAQSKDELGAAFERLKKAGQTEDERKIAMHTRYFDTNDGTLRTKKWTLRTRQENDAHVLTFKTKGEGHCRGEWNLERIEDGSQPTRQELLELVSRGAPELLLELGALEVCCEAKFVRHAAMLNLSDGTKVELAADEGQLRGREEHLDFYELELELYGGSYEKMLLLAKQTALSEEPLSKAARAMVLR